MRDALAAAAAGALSTSSSGRKGPSDDDDHATIDELCRALDQEMSDIDFRLREAVGRGAYNKLFLHNQGLVYSEVNKVWGGWKTASVIEKADFLQEGGRP